MLLERISDGAFVTANKLDVCLYELKVRLRIICKYSFVITAKSRLLAVHLLQ